MTDGAHSHTFFPDSPLVTVAAADSPHATSATYQCHGIDDQEVVRLALSESPAVTLLPGTFTFSAPLLLNRDALLLQGCGHATVIRHSPDFPADQFLIAVYQTATRPGSWVWLRDFHVEGSDVAQAVHGLQFCCCRGGLERLSLYNLSGDGLKVENAEGWDGFESKYSQLNIGHCKRYGIHVRSTDQHWSDIVVHGSGEANLYGGFGGCMVSNSHFYAAGQSATGKQTVDNVVLFSCSRTRFVNCKFEHARRYVLHLKGDPKGGSLSFSNCGFRNGSSEGDGLHPQVRMDRSGGNSWEVGWHGCWFDADECHPSRNIEIVGDVMWGNRFDGCSFKHYTVEPMTPFGNGRGTLSTVNGQGWNATDPNVGGVWLNNGEMGLEVYAADSGKLFRAVGPARWVEVGEIGGL